MSTIVRRVARTGLIAGAATIALLASTLAGVAEPAEAAAPKPNLGTQVTGHSATALNESTPPKSSTSIAVTQDNLGGSESNDVALPASGSTRQTTHDLKNRASASVASGWATFGSHGLQAARAKPAKANSKSSVGAIAVTLLGHDDAKKYGINGVAFAITARDGGTSPAPVALKIPDALLASSYGADYASRVRWVQLTMPAKPSKKALSSGKLSPVAATASGDSAIVTPQLAKATTLLVPMSTPTGADGTGSFAATPIKPSSTWDVSAQTGGFSWSYPLRVPPAPAGPQPNVALNYDSQAVDGETGSTNNQTSAVGEGWDLGGAGYIETHYIGCSQDSGSSGSVASSGDLCWKTDNATLSLGGHSSPLVRDSASGTWKLQNDDGSRVEHLVGAAQGCGASNGTWDDDCWRVTTLDGTQYYFGLNQLPGWSTGKATTNSAWTVPVFGNDAGEPCHASTFAASSCDQGWRWNLDYVVDPHQNAEAFYWSKETNNYQRNGSTAVGYVRGGQLDHIDYGLRSGDVYTANDATDRVTFTYDQFGRCSDSSHASCTTEPLGAGTAPAQASSYPDVPFDELCTSGACTTQLSPTFWSTAMLDTVTTQYSDGAGNYKAADTWDLSHSFPDPGDATHAALWLTQVVHTGHAGTATLAEPATVFSGVTMQNRVWAIDGLAPLDKYRISAIRESTGAVISVNYATPDCTTSNASAIESAPESNTHRCYPQWWTPDTTYPQPAQEDLFNKYVVTSVVSDPKTGGGADLPQETDYVYTGTPAWRYDTSPFTPDSQRTWSAYAGYDTVEVRTGDPSSPSTQQTTAYTFFRGLDGDRASISGGTKSISVTGYPGVADSRWLAGRTYDAKTLNGVGGAIVSETRTTPWSSAITASNGTDVAKLVADGDVLTTQPLSGGGSRTTDVATTFDSSYGLPLTVSTVHSDGASTCSTTSYVTPNTTAWLIGYPKQQTSVAKDCAHLGTAVYPADAISDRKITYDGAAWGAAPNAGDATSSSEVDSYTGSTASSAHWATDHQQSYDAFGRALTATDVLGHTSSTAYTPAATAAAGSGPLTKTVTTNTAPFNWTTTTQINPAWGVETSYSDENAKVTTANYDALGQRTQVWIPIRPQGSNPSSPSIAYSYNESTTVPNTIVTTKVGPASNLVSYQLFDGLGRAVQTQTNADAGGGSIVSDTAYDPAGLVTRVNNSYWATANPSTALFVPTSESQIASETRTLYDGAGRSTATILDSFGTEKHRTSTAYLGADRVDTTPPQGGTPTSQYTDSSGNVTKLVQYLADTPLSTATTETTNYGYDASKHMTTMTDPAGNHWTWGYDVLGHKVQAVDPDTGTTTSSYDDAGEVLSITDGRGQQLSYSYDALGRQTAKYAGTTSGSLLASWTFDTLANGQLTESKTYVGSTPGSPGAAYASTEGGYDANYNPTSTTVTLPASAPNFGATTYKTSYLYAADGSISQATYPAAGGLSIEKLKYSYSATGQLLGEAGTNVILSTIDYTPIGQISQYARTGGSTPEYTDYSYDPATGAVAEILDQTFAGSTPTTISDRHYGYNDAGLVTSEKTTADGTATDNQCFSNDHLGQLTEAWTPANGNCSTSPTSGALGGPAPYWTQYTLDPATGNRTSTTDEPTSGSGTATSYSYTYPAAGTANPHAVQSVSPSTGGSTTFGYDSAGNTTTRGTGTLTYDADGRVSSITSTGHSENDIYDASGQLLLRTDDSGSTLFVGGTELHRSNSTAAVSAVRTYTANGQSVAERATSPGVSGSTLQWLITDAQNTATAEVDPSTGNATHRYQDPFGNARGTAVPWSSPHGFLNQEQSAQTDLVQLGARVYDSTLGRFLSVDSVLAPMNPLQNNGYSYAANNPITKADPSGDCYNSETGAFNMLRNCAGTNPQNGYQPGANNIPKAPKAPGNNPIAQGFLNTGKPGKDLLHAGGFNLGADGILRSDANAPQLHLGYDDGDDVFMDAVIPGARHHKYIFEYGGKSYVVWVWKGEYGLWGDGAEIGLYDQDSPVADPGGHWHANPSDPNLPRMTESLSDNGSEVASFAPAKPQAWVASFHPGVMDMNGDNLHVTATVTFRNAGMYDAFMKSRDVAGVWTPNPTTDTATLKY
ncbi:RHS repeat-associated core domain-containing protein [Lysinimonas soli]|uniref:RHS repeat-associated core domain-containing protein n=1 Tax=Lysinimonas soli TaxID=1074233 RepID=A0ABW0NUQ4_9MICO